MTVIRSEPFSLVSSLLTLNPLKHLINVYNFHIGATSGIMFLAFIMDLVVWKKADRIDIDPENASTSETEYEKAETSAPESTV